MPLYEYRCFACGTRFEKLMGYSATADGVTCPNCNSVNAKRLLSLFAPVSKNGASSTMSDADWSSGGGCGCSSCSCGHVH